MSLEGFSGRTSVLQSPGRSWADLGTNLRSSQPTDSDSYATGRVAYGHDSCGRQAHGHD